MKTKRIFSWLLVIVLCLAVLSACSSGKKETDGTTAATGTGKPSEVEW